MPTQIIHQAHKVTYKWTFNQNVETGTFWDGSPYIINTSNLKLLDVEMQTEFGLERPNTVIPNIELGFAGNVGFKGELYINGLAKNPRGQDDYGPDGKVRNKGNVFDSRSFGTSNKGWTPYKRVRINGRWTKVPNPTNVSTSYNSFDLNSFLDTKAKLSSTGIDLTFGDVLVVQWSNFDINCSYAWDIANASGYPYQRLRNRSCCYSYGTLFVLNSHPSEISFRPPVLWPEEDRTNRPIHPISAINGALPLSSELVSNPWTRNVVPNFANDSSFRTFCYGFPFGNGTTYSQSMPLYSASTDAKISAYGAYFQAPLIIRLQTLYSNDIANTQKMEALKSIVQWGIDAYGSIKSYACTSSGAGQRPCTARPWSIIAGYYLNQPAMRSPETTMISDTVRSNGFLNNRGAPVEDEDGNPETENQPSDKMVMIYGNPNASLTAKKRWHSLQIALEAMCYYKVADEPGNVLDYRTLGRTHRRTFSGAGANLQETSEATKYSLLHVYRDSSTFNGVFAKIQWDTVPPDLNKNWAASHDGKSSTFWYSYIKVISGPGAGDTLYRIIKPWGDFRNAKPNNQLNATGYGFILDRPWQNGQPDQTSVFELITCIQSNVGETFYLIGPTRFSGMADANLSPTSPYAGICEALVVPLYGWMYYIQNKEGVNPDIDKDATLAHDYVQRIVFDSPYQWVTYSTDFHVMGAYPWEQAVLNKWYSRSGTPTQIAQQIDWSHFPGITRWCGVDITSEQKNLYGDDNQDQQLDSEEKGKIGESNLKSTIFTEEEKQYFTELRFYDIEKAKETWSNATKYSNMNRLMNVWIKSFGGEKFFKDNILSENLDPTKFGIPKNNPLI